MSKKGKADKKKQKMMERIEALETGLREALGKKTHNSAEISIADQLNKINEMKQQLAKM